MKYGKSSTGNPLTKYVNMFQSKEERNYKYWLCRDLGCNPKLAQQLRSWRLCRIRQFLFARNGVMYAETETMDVKA